MDDRRSPRRLSEENGIIDETTSMIWVEREVEDAVSQMNGATRPWAVSTQNGRRSFGRKKRPKAKGNDDDHWTKRIMEQYGSVELLNTGSVARDHLALERTFLAWLRTSLSFASIGIAIAQLFRLNTTLLEQSHLRHVGKPLGASFIIVSMIVLFIGFHRYFESQHYIIQGKFPASRGSVIVVALITATLVVSSLTVVLSLAPSVLMGGE